MLKRIISAVSAVLISTALFTGCSAESQKKDDKINIVCTVFPAYDWTRQIIGDSDNINLTYLLSNGSDLHNFQPTTDDIIKISDCDIFIYVGGESDTWVEDVLKNSRNKDMKIVNLLDVLADSVVEEEIKEGMNAEDDEHDHNHGETEYDEHIWLSVRNAEKCVNEIWETIYHADEIHSGLYTNNAKIYIDELKNLDSSFCELFDDNPQTLIFGDRMPFRYFIEDYNLDYYAAFSGCSADTEASFETITFLAQKADELNADTIFAIENSDCTIADAVITNTKSKSQNIAVLDSAQSVTQQQIDDGVTYYSIMKKNYDVLQEVFQ